MIGNEIEKRNQFREQSLPTRSQIQGQEIEAAHKSVVSVVSPCVPCFLAMFPLSTFFRARYYNLANKHFSVENQQFSIQLHGGIVSWVQLQKRLWRMRSH